MNTNFRPIPTAEDRRTIKRQGSLNRDPGRMRRSGYRGRARNETEEERAMRLEEERQNFLRRPSVSDDEMETTPPESPRYYSDDESYRLMNRKKIVTFQDPRMMKGRGGLATPNGQVQGGFQGRGGPVGRGISRGGPGQVPRQGPPFQHGSGGPGIKVGYGPNQGPGRGTSFQGVAPSVIQHRGQVPLQGVQQGPETRPGLAPPHGGQYGPRGPNVYQGQRPNMSSQQQGPGFRSQAPVAQPPGSPRPGQQQQQQHGPNLVQHGSSVSGVLPNQQQHGPNFGLPGPLVTGAMSKQQQHGPNFVQHGPMGLRNQLHQGSAEHGQSGTASPQQRQPPSNFGQTLGQQQVRGPNFVRGTAGQQQQQVAPQGYGPEGVGQGPLQQQHGSNFVPHGPGGPQVGRSNVNQQSGQQVTPGGTRPGFGPQQGQMQAIGPTGTRPAMSGPNVGRGNVPVGRPSVVSQPGGTPGGFMGSQSSSVPGRQGAPPVRGAGTPSQSGVVMNQAKARPNQIPKQNQKPGGPQGNVQQHVSVPVSQPQTVGPPVSQSGIGAPVVKRSGKGNQNIAQVSHPSNQPPPLTNAYLGAPHTPASRLSPVTGQQNDNVNRPGSSARQVSPGRVGTGPSHSDDMRRKGMQPSLQSVEPIPGTRGEKQDIRRKGTPPSQGIQSDTRSSQLNPAAISSQEMASSIKQAFNQSDSRGGQFNSAQISPREMDNSTRQEAPILSSQSKKKTSSAPRELQPNPLAIDTSPVQLREKAQDNYGTGRDQGYRDSFGFELEDEELPDNSEKMSVAPTPAKVSCYNQGFTLTVLLFFYGGKRF